MIIHEEFTKIINEENKYHKLEENIRMVKSGRSDREKDKHIRDKIFLFLLY